jgi:hypothetical protein
VIPLPAVFADPGEQPRASGVKETVVNASASRSSGKTLDCSDLDQHIGKPMQPGRMRDPVANMDIRRWAQAMHYPNRLHYDDGFAAESRFGRLVAPQSFAVACDDGQGVGPACIGKIPDSHLVFGGDEWWFHGPRIYGGDLLHSERAMFDYAIKDTRFAGPTCFQRGDNHYYNQNGELIATQRSTSIRYLADAPRAMGALASPSSEEPEWSDEQLEEIEEGKFGYVKTLHALGHDRRSWAEVQIGDKLPTRIIGPHSIASFTTEWRAYLFSIWCGVIRRTDLDMEALGFSGPMVRIGKELDPVLELENPEQTDGAYVGPSRGHLFPRWARTIGMPRSYGYGASMGSWILDYLAGWAGEWGSVIHSSAAYRGPALSGDITIMEGIVIDKKVDEEKRSIVQVDCKLTSQLGSVLATAKAEIELPATSAS